MHVKNTLYISILYYLIFLTSLTSYNSQEHDDEDSSYNFECMQDVDCPISYTYLSPYICRYNKNWTKGICTSIYSTCTDDNDCPDPEIEVCEGKFSRVISMNTHKCMSTISYCLIEREGYPSRQLDCVENYKRVSEFYSCTFAYDENGNEIMGIDKNFHLCYRKNKEGEMVLAKKGHCWRIW